MDILKKIIISNNKRPILLNTDSRNDNSLSKTNQTCKTNYINNKSSYVNIQNSKIKLRKNIPISKMNISFSKKNNCNNNKNEPNKECKLISYIDLGNNKIKKYLKNKHEISQDSKHNYTFKKDLIINNNITNNISNHITNIILTNNNNNNSHIARKYPNNLKKSNRVENKNYIFHNKNNVTNNDSNINDSNNNNLSHQLQKKKRLIKNNLLIERCSYNCSKNIKNDLTSRNNKNIKAKFQNIKSSQKEKEKENKIKNIIERNKRDIRTYFTSYINSSSNLNINKNNNPNVLPKNKNNIINKKNLYKYKNITNNIELNLNTKKLKQNSLKKLKEFQTYNSNSKNNLIKFTSSAKYLEDSMSLNSINSKKNKISNKNNTVNSNNYQQYIKTNKNINNNNYLFTKIQKQYKPKLDIHINDIKNLNQMRSLFDKRITSANTNKSFGDRNYNNISYINSSITIKGGIKTNNFRKSNQTLFCSNSKSKSKENNIFKYKNKNDLINNIYKNYKTDRSLSNYTKDNYNNTNDENSNINIINIINNFNNKNISYNKSFLSNNTDLLKNKTLKSQKRKISLNIYKNIKKYFLSKSLQRAKNFDISSTYINYKSDNYNSYKEQFLYNKANSYRNISYVSRERDSTKNYTKLKKPKYYSNQKKIHNKKIIINKKKNRCKKGNAEYTEFNIGKNDLINLINIKNNNIIIKKKSLRRNPKSIQNYSKAAYTMNKNKYENKINEFNNGRETYNSIPMNVLKNIFSINSEHFSPKPTMKNNLMKSYNININNIPKVQGGMIKQNKSFKISNPYHNISSLTKKKKIKIEDIINNKDNNINNKRNNKDDKLTKDNKESKIKEIDNSNIILENKECKEISQDKSMNKKNDKSSKTKDNTSYIKHFHKSKTNQNFTNSNSNIYELEIKKPIANEETAELKNHNIIPRNKTNNPQYLYEYIFDILQNLLLDESYYISNNYINPNYLYSYNEDTEITPEIRGVSINWLIMIIYKIFKFKENTLFLTVQIIDRFLSKKILSVERTELLILCSLILSSKHEEIDYVNMVESLQLSSNKFTKEEIINMQYEILNELNFELIIPTMSDFYNIYCTILNLNEIDINKGIYLLNIILVEYNIIKYPNFIISLAVVKLIYKKNINNIIKRLRYYFIKNKQDKFLNIINDEKYLDKVCHKIKKIYKNYTTNRHTNIEEKFSDEKYNSVATNFSCDLIDISDI